MSINRENVSLLEEFTRRNWVQYDSFDPTTKAHLNTQNHIDIRTFAPDSAEKWTAGTFGYQVETGMFPALRLPIEAGKVFEATSVTLDHVLDLKTGFGPEDFITMGLGNFFPANLNLVQSYIDITSDPLGNVANTALTVSVALSQSETTLVGGGNRQFQVKRSAFEGGGLDLEKVTAVRFRIKGTGNTVLYITGLKLILAPVGETLGWEISTVDYDNWNGRLVKPTPLDANAANGPAFETSTVWKAAQFPGAGDPQPIDTEMGIVFYTGQQKHNNNFTLFCREESKIFQTQLDLIGRTMSDMDGESQPDLGTVAFLPRTISEFEGADMELLDGEDMGDFERVPVSDPVEQSWIYFQLKWGASEEGFVLSNSSSPGYVFTEFDTPLQKEKYYLLVCSLEGSAAQARIYPLNSDFSVNQKPVFNSTLIEDDGIFRRRPGRIGWQANLADPDAFIASIRPRGVSFAEYVSAPLNSLTPVVGAQLYSHFTPNQELWDGALISIPEGSQAQATKDTARSVTGSSYRITTTGTEAGQGFGTNFFLIDNLEQTTITFALWYIGEARTEEFVPVAMGARYPAKKLYPPFFPGNAYTASVKTKISSIRAQLVSSEGTIIPLTMPEIEPNEWQFITLNLPTDRVIQTGFYSLEILQPTKAVATWWLDALSIFHRAIQWSARSVVDDPWKSNYAPWTDFRDITNLDGSGVLFNPRGNELQLRARALQQNARIVQAPKLKPKYAQLGRLVWPENELTGLVPPTVTFTEVQEGLSYTFTDTSTPGTGAIVSRSWTFGDGTRDTGPIIRHTYSGTGSYVVTLVVTDRNGQRSHLTKTIFV